MLWSFVQTFGKQGIGFVVFLWLTTMLEPEDFGLLGMALVVTSLVQAFSEVGFGPALIQRKELKPSHISSVFIFNILVGALLTFIGVMVSGYGARLFRIH
ncbi:MAG TPA: flippase, partial [Deltaproteobacteria bacterium]|nr:flippase [Deltaproteobacteria bacterium]